MTDPALARRDANRLTRRGWDLSWDPAGLELGGLREYDGRLEVGGSAASADDVVEYQTRLESSPHLRDIRMDSFTAIEGERQRDTPLWFPSVSGAQVAGGQSVRYDDEFDRPEPDRRGLWIMLGSLLVAGIVVGAWYYLLYEPLDRRIAEGEAELATIRAERASQRDPRGRIASTDRALFDLCRRRAERQQELPREPDSNGLHHSLEEVAHRAEVELRDTEELPIQRGVDFSVVPIEMSFRATEREIRVLLGLVGILPRLVTISDLRWQPAPEVVETEREARRRRRQERRMREEGRPIPRPGPPEFDVNWVVNGYFADDGQREVPEPCAAFRDRLNAEAAEQQAEAEADAAEASEEAEPAEPAGSGAVEAADVEVESEAMEAPEEK